MKNIYANPVEITKDIYKITNLLNNKIYIGQSKNAKERFKGHCKGCYDNSLIDKAIQDYGKENFKLEILEHQITNYNEREKYWIKYYNSLSPNGYNMMAGGNEPPTFYGVSHPLASIKNLETLNKIYNDLITTQKSYSQIAYEYKTNKKTVMNINNGIRYVQEGYTYPLRKNKNINGKLTEDDVDAIIYELEHSYESNTSIGAKFNVSEHTIREINTGKAHKRSNITYPIRSINAVRSKVNYNQLMEIIALLKNSDLSMREIAKRYNINHHIVLNINRGSNIYHRKDITYPIRNPNHIK